MSYYPLISMMPKATPYSFLLDDYPGAAAAYSLRKLRSAYSGNCIRVRRSSDNTEQDFGFVNNVLDTASLLAFVGAGNGFITTWYDQSGNALNQTQTTAINQAQIVSSGNINLSNSKPSLLFNTNKFLTYNSYLFTGASQRTIISIYQPTQVSGSFTYNIFGQCQFSGTTGQWSMIQARNIGPVADPYFAGFAADLGNGTSTPNTLQKLAEFYYNGTNGSLYKNSSLMQSANIGLNATTSGIIAIGATTGVLTMSEYANANITECIIYTNNQSANRTGIESNINSFYTIY